MYRVIAFTVKPRASADTRYRVLEYVAPAERDGIEILHRSLMSERFFAWQMHNSNLLRRVALLPWMMLMRLWQVLFEAPHYDAVWILREMAPMGPPVFERLLRWRCKRVILDVDDALHVVDKEGSRWLPRLLRDHEKFGRMAKRYDVVVCGNEYLAEFYRSKGGRVAVIPTVVDPDLYAEVASSSSKAVRIGWIGTPLNRHHVESIGPALCAVARETGCEFSFVGISGAFDWGIDGVRYPQWSLAEEISFFRGFDIGIMPLKDSAFARGKCAFKLIQYMAAGLPVVASPVGANVEVVQDGVNGWIADSEAEWTAALKRLIGDGELRRTMGAAGREIVRERYSVQSAWPVYRSTFLGGKRASDLMSRRDRLLQQGFALPVRRSRASFYRWLFAVLVGSVVCGLSYIGQLLHGAQTMRNHGVVQAAVSVPQLTSYLAPATDGMATPHRMKVGVDADNWSGQARDPAFAASLVAMQVDFVSWHVQPDEETPEHLGEIVRLCREHGWSYLFNTEFGNYERHDPRLKHEDGTYRYDLAESTLAMLKDDPLFLGVVYDETDLMQAMNGMPDGKGGALPPSLVETRSMTAPEAFNAVSLKVRELQSRYQRYGKRLIFEMTFPDSASAYARGGALLAPKLLKETYDDLMYSVYRGAALEYHSAEMWACADLWFMDRFPTAGKGGGGYHSPEQLLDALQFANAAGFDFVYVEQAKGLMDGAYQLTSYGRAVMEFQAKRASTPRGNWRTAPIQYYVRRFPDGYWGQDFSHFIPDHPYGSWLPNPYRAEDKEWFALLSRLSDGALPADADTWNAQESPFFRDRPYSTMAGLPLMVVFDPFGEIPRETSATVVDLCKSEECPPRNKDGP